MGEFLEGHDGHGADAGARASGSTRDRDAASGGSDVVSDGLHGDDATVLPPRLQPVRSIALLHAQHLAAEYAALAPSWRGRDEGASTPEDDDEDLRVALALRCTQEQAARRIRDAHLAVEHLPRTLERLRSGDIPAPWFTRVLRESRDLPPASRRAVDDAVGTWDLTCTAEQFSRRVSRLLTHLVSRAETPEHLLPAARRRVELLPPGTDGTASLQIVGPIPDVLSLSRRLDATARAVQAGQRRALEAGEPLPCDPDGVASARGRALSLAQLRFDLLCGAAFDPQGSTVPADRFRITVTVPALTLLGASDEPGMIDGAVPLPADMARSLAGGDDVWHRVLTDPASGAFLPLPAARYTPTRAMLEHLRLRRATCAVPGCTRPSSWASECDHIEEFRHQDPERGGRTEIENLHLLCWQHHQAKTDGRLDPQRLPRRGHPPGETAWNLGDGTRCRASDDVDLATPQVVRELESAWRVHQQIVEARRRAAARIAALREKGLRPGELTTGPDGRPGWVVRSDGHLDPPGEAPPF